MSIGRLRRHIDPAVLARALAVKRGDISREPVAPTIVQQKPPRPAITYRATRRSLQRQARRKAGG